MDVPGEKLLIRLWETLSEKGIGSLLAPWQIVRNGSARIEVRRRELLVLAQAERQAAEIRAGRSELLPDGTVKALPPPTAEGSPGSIELVGETIDIPKLVHRSAAEKTADDIQRQVNVHKAVLHAEEELAKEEQAPPERNVEDDWLYTWRDYAARVSSDELQQLWGRLLAGEVKSPGSFSIRTLDFLKSISRIEAEKISLIAQFVVEGTIFRGDKEFLEKNGVPYGLLLELQDLGVIAGVESLGLTVSWKSNLPDSYVRALRSNGKVLVVKHSDASKIAKIPNYPLTVVGKQVMNLGSFSPHEEYLRRVGEHIKGQGFDVYLADWKQESVDAGRYYNEVKL